MAGVATVARGQRRRDGVLVGFLSSINSGVGRAVGWRLGRGRWRSGSKGLMDGEAGADRRSVDCVDDDAGQSLGLASCT